MKGFLLALGYSTQRGFGRTHPFVGEIRLGLVAVSFAPEELGFEIEIGEIEVTECQMVNQFEGSKTEPAQFTRGYGLVFGHAERKAMSMALVDRALRVTELGEEATAPAQDQEFVLYHADNIQATGFVEHLKLPHYVDFQGELETIRRLRAAAVTSEAAEMSSSAGAPPMDAGGDGIPVRDDDTARETAASSDTNAKSTRCASHLEGYNFAYLDEQTKRMIRRAILKAVAIPGYQVPFASRDMPLPYGWGTGGIQVTAACIGPDDVLEVSSIRVRTTPPTRFRSAPSFSAPPM